MWPLIFMMLALSVVALRAEIRAGAAEVDITPPEGAPLAGYYSNRAADGALDRLHAKAIVLSAGGADAALVTCDVVGLPAGVVQEARRIAQQQTGIAADHIMISATHTHTGPVMYTKPSRYNLQGDMERIATKYTADLPAIIASAVTAAYRKREPVILRASIGQEETLPFNRRYFMQDGSVGWNPGKLNPKIVRPAGPIDPAVPIFAIESIDGRAIAVYVNYSMHPDTTGGTAYSADYPGALSRSLRTAKGEQLITLFAMGTAGNVNHVDVKQKERQSSAQEAARIGVILAASVLKAWKTAQVVDVPALNVRSKHVALGLAGHQAGEEAWAEKVSATFGQAGAAPFLDLVRAARILDVQLQHGQPWSAEVQVIMLGKTIAIVAFPAEVFVEIGLSLKQDSPFPYTMIATQANGAMSYLPNRKAFREGAYEVISSRAAPGSAEALLDAAQTLLQEH